jgi:hypothetical protein
VDVEAVGEQERRAVLHRPVQVVAVDVRLELVGGEHHHHVRGGGRLRHLHHRQPLLLGLGRRGRALAERDHHVLDAGVAKVERVRVALAAVADDGDALALDQVDVGVAIVIDAHERIPPSSGELIDGGAASKRGRARGRGACSEGHGRREASPAREARSFVSSAETRETALKRDWRG